MSVAALPQLPAEDMAAANEVVRVEHLSHAYGRRHALRDVSFTVGPAQILGLLGPNGSGKTTLFRILSTLIRPGDGTALIGGGDVRREPDAVRRRIGVVFQSPTVDLKLTARENLVHQGHLYGLRGSTLRSRVDEMLTRVGLLERADELVEKFSGGMQRRVEIAKGLLHKPQVLLLDEPTNGLDPGTRRDLWDYLKLLRDSEGITILITTHLMEEAERCDRLLILDEGSVVASGTPLELRSSIGGDVVWLQTPEAHSLSAAITRRFTATAAVIEGKVRVEIANGHRFAAEVVDAFRGDITAVSISKPTLEDVFIQRTGHRFWTAQAGNAGVEAVGPDRQEEHR